MTDDGPTLAGRVVPRARRCFGAHCEVVLAGVIVAASCIGAAILFIRMYGPAGVAAWFVAFGAWAYAAARYPFEDVCPSDRVAAVVLVGGFAAQATLNSLSSEIGNVVFLTWHAIAITAAVRRSSFPRARARARSRGRTQQCSSG